MAKRAIRFVRPSGVLLSINELVEKLVTNTFNGLTIAKMISITDRDNKEI